jgi:glycosyltransferase involved in cell wall biosynthesis
VVVSDNCSTDQSLGIISKYRNRNLKLITTPIQVSAVNNWRACFKEADTDFVFTIGGDDHLASYTIANFNQYLERYSDLEIFYFYFSNFDDGTLEEISTSPHPLLLEKVASCFYCGLKILLSNPSLDEFGLGLHQRAQLQEQALLSSDTTQSFFYWLGLLGFIKTCLRNGRIMYHQEISVYKRQQTSYEGKGNFRMSPTARKSWKVLHDTKNAWVVASQIKGAFKFELFAFIFLNTFNIKQTNWAKTLSSAVLNRWIQLMHSRRLNVMNCYK